MEIAGHFGLGASQVGRDAEHTWLAQEVGVGHCGTDVARPLAITGFKSALFIAQILFDFRRLTISWH